jgi:hypothetical protein
LITVAAFALAGPVPGVLAATFTTNSIADQPDSKPGDGLCLTADGNCTLRAAIMETNALGGGPHTITLVAGTLYTLTRTGAGEDAAATGDLDIAADVTITVSGGSTTVAGTTGWDDRIFDVLSTGTVELKGLDIRGGKPPAGSDGGGILNAYGGRLTLTNSTVSNNVVSGIGAGIENLGTLTLTNSTVSRNTIVRGAVGGIDNIGTLTLTNSTVSGNSDSSYDIGGIWNESVFGFPTARTTLTNSTVSGNRGTGVGNTFANMTVTNSTVSGNSSVYYGGGIFNDTSNLTLTGSTVSGNSAADGGGIVNIYNGRMTLTNSTVSGNSARGDGGGLWSAGSVSANNVSLARNVADADADGNGDGGGIFNYSGETVVNIVNTIIGTNADASPSSTAKSPDCRGSLTSQGYNLIQNTTGCTIGGDTTGNITGRDPQLGPLQDNGGPTFTHALESRTVKLFFGSLTIPSPAIDAGSPAACTTTDQRGVPRPVDGNADGAARCDIGAYEYFSLFGLGTWSLAPVEATVRAGEPLTYRLIWTVPEGRGWRSLDTLQLRLADDEGTALWLRFQEVAGAPGVFSVVDRRNGNVGPSFAPGSPNRLESDAATVDLADASVAGPPGRQVTLILPLSFKPLAVGHTYDVLVLATDDSDEVQGFHRAGTVAVSR